MKAAFSVRDHYVTTFTGHIEYTHVPTNGVLNEKPCKTNDPVYAKSFVSTPLMMEESNDA